MAQELSREELAEMLKGIIAHNRDYPPKNAVKLCNKCRKRKNYTATCEVYPNGIPKKVLMGDCPDFEAKEQTEQA